MAKIRILLVDDHTLFREGVRALLEKSADIDIEVVGEAGDGHEAIDLTHALAPDVVVMDLNMPGMGGIDATRRISEQHPEIRILVLTMHESADYFFETLRAGASGYVLKDAAGMDLLVAIKAVHQGGVFIYPSIARGLVANFMDRVANGEERATYKTLTPREREILAQVGEGLTNKEIADTLNLSVNTVQTHRSHIMEKLDLRGRTELMRYAIRLGHPGPPAA